MIQNLNADLTELLDIPELIADDYEIQKGIVFIHAHPKNDTERFDFLNPNKSYTKRFAEWIHKIASKTDLNFVSELEGLGYKKVESIFYSISKQKLNSEKELKFDKIGIDSR